MLHEGEVPGADADVRDSRTAEVEQWVDVALDDVASLDHDRILRAYLTHIRATLRTNYFQTDAEGGIHPYISLKLEPSAIPEEGLRKLAEKYLTDAALADLLKQLRPT